MDYRVGHKLPRFYTEHNLQNTADRMQGALLCVVNEHSSLLREQRSLPVELPSLHVGQVRPEGDIVFIYLCPFSSLFVFIFPFQFIYYSYFL